MIPLFHPGANPSRHGPIYPIYIYITQPSTPTTTHLASPIRVGLLKFPSEPARRARHQRGHESHRMNYNLPACAYTQGIRSIPEFLNRPRKMEDGTDGTLNM